MTTQNMQGFQTPRRRVQAKHCWAHPRWGWARSQLLFSVQMFRVVWPRERGREWRGLHNFPSSRTSKPSERLRWKRGTSLEVEKEELDRMRTKIEQTHVVDCARFFFFSYIPFHFEMLASSNISRTWFRPLIYFVLVVFCFVFGFFAGHLEQDY